MKETLNNYRTHMDQAISYAHERLRQEIEEDHEQAANFLPMIPNQHPDLVAWEVLIEPDSTVIVTEFPIIAWLIPVKRVSDDAFCIDRDWFAIPICPGITVREVLGERRGQQFDGTLSAFYYIVVDTKTGRAFSMDGSYGSAGEAVDALVRHVRYMTNENR